MCRQSFHSLAELQNAGLLRHSLAVTNRHLCQGDFLAQLEQVCALAPAGIILREKDLSASEYLFLARQVLSICSSYHVPCILHSFPEIADALDCPNIHLPLPVLQKNAAFLSSYEMVGTSVHSLEESLLAQQLGATYLTAGHIFSTQCKPDLEPRGLSFLSEITDTVSLPVWAIGGIHPDNFLLPLEAGATGNCMMSEFMKV